MPQVGLGSSLAGSVSDLAVFCYPNMHRLLHKASFARCIIPYNRHFVLESTVALQGVSGGNHARPLGMIAALEVSTDSTKKKTRLSRQERTTVVETYVSKHMASHQGQFPTLSVVLRETGGSRVIVKEILNELSKSLKLEGATTMVNMDSNTVEAQETENEEADLDLSTNNCFFTETDSARSTLSHHSSMVGNKLSDQNDDKVVNVYEDSKLTIAKDDDFEELIMKEAGVKGPSFEQNQEGPTLDEEESTRANKGERKTLWERLNANSSIATRQTNGAHISKLKAASYVSDITKRVGDGSESSHFGSRDEAEDLDFASLDFPEGTKLNRAISSAVKHGPGKEIKDKKRVESFSTKHVLFVRFLHPDATDEDLRIAFQDCGPISRARPVRSRKGSQSKYIYGFVDFDTAEGLRNALRKHAEIRGVKVETSPSTSKQYDTNGSTSDQTTRRHAVPVNGLGSSYVLKQPQTDSILDEGYPVLLEDVPQDISFQVQDALSAHGEIISSYSKVRGSGNVSAFVNFKTEEAKESALAAHWAHLGGKPFRIQRLDRPKTTVVRISSIAAETSEEKIVSTCKLCGYVDWLKPRSKGVVDVYFHPNEIRNIIQILERLNEVHIDKRRWRAQPAPMYSPKAIPDIRRSDDDNKWLQSQQFHVVDNLEVSLKEALMHVEDLKELLSLQWSANASSASTIKINSLTSLLREAAKS